MPIRNISPKTEIARQVFRAMGLERGTTLAKSSKPEVHKFLQPYAKEPYPTRMAGDRAKLPIEFSIRGWGHLEALKKLVGDRKLAGIIAKTPGGMKLFESALKTAIIKRGLKGYEAEWCNLSPSVVEKGVVARSLPQRIGRNIFKPTPYLANEYSAKLVLPDVVRGIEKLKHGKLYTIVGLGCGAGGTDLPIIERLSKAQRKKIMYVGLDVMGSGLKTDRTELQKLGIPSSQIITLRGNTGRMNENVAVRQFFGKADLVTSGATIHHLADVSPVFRGVKSLLKPNGIFCLWDWGHAAWRAPALIVAPEGARVEKHGLHYERGLGSVEAPKGHAFISRGQTTGISRGYAPKEIEAVREMFSTWIRLLVYPEAEKIRFQKFFDNAVRRGEPINFVEYLRRLEKTQTEKGEFGQFYFWEGHRPPEFYHDAMREAGLIGQKEKPFTIYPTQSSLLYQIKVRK